MTFATTVLKQCAQHHPTQAIITNKQLAETMNAFDSEAPRRENAKRYKNGMTFVVNEDLCDATLSVGAVHVVLILLASPPWARVFSTTSWASRPPEGVH